MKTVTVVKTATIDKYNMYWPRHARGRKLTTLSCGHLVYDLPQVCPICKRQVEATE